MMGTAILESPGIPLREPGETHVDMAAHDAALVDHVLQWVTDWHRDNAEYTTDFEREILNLADDPRITCLRCTYHVRCDTHK